MAGTLNRAILVIQDPLDDATVGSLELEWRGDRSSFLVRASAPEGSPPGLLVLQNLTTVRDLDDLALLIGGLLDSRTRATDVGGYGFRDGAIVAWDAGDNEVTLSRSTFTDLLARVLDEVIRNVGSAGNDDRAAKFENLAAALRRSETRRLDGTGPGVLA